MAPKVKNIKKDVESAKSGLDVLKGLFQKPSKKLTDEAKQAAADFTATPAEYQFAAGAAPVVPTPGLVSRTATGLKQKAWTDRSLAGKAGVAYLLGGQVLPAALNIGKSVAPGIVQGPVGAWKDVFGIGNEPETTAPGLDLAPQAPVDLVADYLANYGNNPMVDQATLDAVARATGSTGSGAAVPGLSAGERNDITAQQKAIEAATTAGGGSMSNLVTPVSGSTARGLESLTNMTKQQQDYLDFVQRAAKASGAKLAGNWRQKYLDQLNSIALKRATEIENLKFKQGLLAAEKKQAALESGILLPDPAALEEAAMKWRKATNEQKAAIRLATNGAITDENSYVRNYVKLQQPQG